MIGETVTRVDGVEKVTGTAPYTGNLELPGMLYAKLVRSTLPHARLLTLDASRAEALRMEALIVETPHRAGPYGSKGVGETAVAPVAPAIGNAVADALGIRLRELPLTPDKVLRALRERQTILRTSGR